MFVAARYQAVMDHLILKWIHIVSSTVLFGTGVGLAFFFFIAHWMRDLGAIRFATRTVVLGDLLFTTPAGIVQIATGLLLANLLGMPLTEPWLFTSLILFVFAGCCWLPVVWIQIKMRNLAAKAESLADLPSIYWRYHKLWVVLGALAFPALLVVFWLMVTKPGL